jgi:hypothetical protein
MFTITKAQIEQLMKAVQYGISEIENITDEEYDFLKSTKDMLQGLLAQSAGEPADIVTDEMVDAYFKGTDFDYREHDLINTTKLALARVVNAYIGVK